jgi:hypothetical protein
VAQKLGTTVAATPGISVVSFKSQVVSCWWGLTACPPVPAEEVAG